MRNGIVLSLMVIAGCEMVESNEIRTDGIYADLSLLADGQGTSTATAMLRVGGPISNTFVGLVEGDTLMAEREGEDPTPMAEVAILDMRSYVAVFEDDPHDVDVRISLTRSEGASAPDSVLSLPQPFRLGELQETYSRTADEIRITWDNIAPEEVAVWVEGDCIANQYLPREADIGEWVLPAGSIEAFDSGAADNCEVTISVTRSRPGTVDANYGDGGAAWGHQVRKHSFTSTP